MFLLEKGSLISYSEQSTRFWIWPTDHSEML